MNKVGTISLFPLQGNRRSRVQMAMVLTGPLLFGISKDGRR